MTSVRQINCLNLELRGRRECALWRSSRSSQHLEEAYCRARLRANQASQEADRIDRFRAACRRERRVHRAAPGFLETIVPGLKYQHVSRRVGAMYTLRQDDRA